MHLSIITKPPAEMRYITVGDWQFREVPLNAPNELRITVTVADTGNTFYNALIGIHELVEAILVGKEYGFRESTNLLVDDFDLNWHNEAVYDEPGDDPAAPYHAAHTVATLVERVLAYALHIPWNDYSKRLDDITEAMTNARAAKPSH